eukprot:TRINITY_DN18977_c0_g1_i1.p1 TRINITY_DN18977_c0_g1~~TRINITY_DN18977_c0_g1_i1.p1  ORF type:complete len:219 (+),score=49.15 TRINITY_DN18977_c0_g1_i1:214-870(+)
MSTNAEYIKEIEAAFDEGIELAKSTEGWKKEKTDKDSGDLVEVRKNEKGRKIYRCRGKISMPKKLLEDALKDTDNVMSWNTTLSETKVLKRISDDVVISYQVTAEAAGGMVSARDFVYGSKVGSTDGGATFVMGGKSVDFPDAPKSSKIVRAVNGPGCQMVFPVEGDENSCEFLWLMDCDYKGWMPSSVLDVAMPIAQTQFLECIRKLAAKLKAEGKY